MDFSKFEENIGYVFQDKSLLQTALTHTSYANEHKVQSNEKLEFLGDAILEFVTSGYLYKNYKNLKEGEMTKVRAAVVCENSLYKVAIKHNFSDFLIVGKSEIFCHGNEKPAILADSVEAVIAAIYLDSGLENVKDFILDNIKDSIEIASQNVGKKDYKTVLQEELQKHGTVCIEYNIIKEEGPDHSKTFTAEVKCDGKQLAIGTGSNKKQAEMEAANKALKNMHK